MISHLQSIDLKNAAILKGQVPFLMNIIPFKPMLEDVTKNTLKWNFKLKD